jgi:hypothetical protein
MSETFSADPLQIGSFSVLKTTVLGRLAAVLPAVALIPGGAPAAQAEAPGCGPAPGAPRCRSAAAE